MWTHPKALPEWGFRQQEINGNKNLLQTSNIWFVDEIIGLQDDCTTPQPQFSIGLFSSSFGL
jgi:dolichyl-phosphate-mannose-protein mannosyltransferase